MELQDPKVCFLYDQLRVKTIICLNDYINSGRGTLAELKERFRRTLPEEERRRVRTVKNLVDTLEIQGVIGDNNVEFLKMLAEELQLSELKHKVEEFETKCSGIFQKAVNVAGRAPGFVWQKFKGGVCTSAIYLKTVLSIKGVQVALAGATLIYVYGTNPEKLKDLQPFVEYGTQLVAIFRGSVVFVLKVSSISSLKRLWQSYKDGSLKEKMKKTFNEMKELKEVSHGEEIDVEVTIDEEEYREVLWDLVLLKAKGNSVKTDTKRQRRHSVCCGRDFPEEVSKPMDVTQIQIRVGRPLTELEISIGNIEGLKEALRGKEFTLSRIAEVEEQRLSEIGRQLSEMEIFLAASGFSEIRMKEAEKRSPSEYVTKSIPSVERRWHIPGFLESESKEAARHPNIRIGIQETSPSESSLAYSSECYKKAASGFSEIRMKEAEKRSPSEYVTKNIPSVERRLHEAASGSSEIRLKEEEKRSPPEYLTGSSEIRLKEEEKRSPPEYVTGSSKIRMKEKRSAPEYLTGSSEIRLKETEKGSPFEYVTGSSEIRLKETEKGSPFEYVTGSSEIRMKEKRSAPEYLTGSTEIRLKEAEKGIPSEYLTGSSEIRLKETERGSPFEYVTGSSEIRMKEKRSAPEYLTGSTEIRLKEAEKGSPPEYLTGFSKIRMKEKRSPPEYVTGSSEIRMKEKRSAPEYLTGSTEIRLKEAEKGSPPEYLTGSSEIRMKEKRSTPEYLTGSSEIKLKEAEKEKKEKKVLPSI